mmetsp:Transcript_24635/g.27562  ORF Transcript_24635/g.27562 Transcript_24635/m.27562 type:complete len:401 (+) Transcript_24635:75-1277(+)
MKRIESTMKISITCCCVSSSVLIPLFALLLTMLVTTTNTKTICTSAFMISPISRSTYTANNKYIRQLQHHRNRKTYKMNLKNNDEEEIESPKKDDDEDNILLSSSSTIMTDRRRVLSTTLGTMLMTTTFLSTISFFSPSRTDALVKGVAPPPKKGGGAEKLKCTNVEECQAMADTRSDQLRAKEEETAEKPLFTKGGVRYRDISISSSENNNDNNNNNINNNDDVGTDSNTTSPIVTAQEGDRVRIFFKVLKLGKRSYDGLSGEGTVVFSRGYGLEDDEDKPQQKDFPLSIGSTSNIAALNEALIGMKVNGLRRFAILPQNGWEKATAACDGGPGGRGDGGVIRTDYVVVPTATVVQQEACFDNTKLPFPSTYAQQRRMAQRFDQSLIMEVQLVSIDVSG